MTDTNALLFTMGLYGFALGIFTFVIGICLLMHSYYTEGP